MYLIQISTVLNFLDITSEFPTVTVFVIVGIQNFRSEFVETCDLFPQHYKISRN